MSLKNLRSCLVFFKCVILLLLTRSYGSIIHDLANKYQGKLTLKDFRSFEKLTIKKRKADLDLSFLKNCRSFNIFPKLICFPLPNTNHHDVCAIRKRLLRSAVLKRSREHRKLDSEHSKLESDLKKTLNPLDWLILSRSLKKNLDKQVKKVVSAHQKKLRNLTKNSTLPFSHHETVTNLSSHHFSEDELDLLKNGLGFSIKPPRLNRADVFTSFEMIYHTMRNNLINKEQSNWLKTKLVHLAQNCLFISSYPE